MYFFICLDGVFVSVRRSVRLRRGFVNLERAPFGGEKLRIPSLLFVEKMRTQSRFNVGFPVFVLSNVLMFVLKGFGGVCLLLQLMRVEVASTSSGGGDDGLVSNGRPRKLMHNASSKVSVVVEKMLLPILDTPLRPHVVFDAVQDQAELDLMEEVDKQHPEVMADSQSFTRHLLGLYDRYKIYSQGYSPIVRM